MALWASLCWTHLSAARPVYKKLALADKQENGHNEAIGWAAGAFHSSLLLFVWRLSALRAYIMLSARCIAHLIGPQAPLKAEGSGHDAHCQDAHGLGSCSYHWGSSAACATAHASLQQRQCAGHRSGAGSGSRPCQPALAQGRLGTHSHSCHWHIPLPACNSTQVSR